MCVDPTGGAAKLTADRLADAGPLIGLPRPYFLFIHTVVASKIEVHHDAINLGGFAPAHQGQHTGRLAI